MKKYLIALVTTFLMALCMSMTTFASDAEINDSSTKIKSPRYEANCQGTPDGKHYMKAHGTARVIDASTKQLIFNGYCYQCSGCYLVLGTERDPWKSHAIGRYASYMPYESLPGIATVIEASYIDSFYGDTRTDSYWQGFIFTKGSV